MKAAVVGAGVIGGGWAARFVLNGVDADVYDPAPGAEAALQALLNRARQAWRALYDDAQRPEGTLRVVTRLRDAIDAADWIQESVPEQLDIKRAVFRDVMQHARNDAVVASSTSGFRPTALGADLPRAGQLLVCHPFNPVYLLPLVEVVPGTSTRPDIVATARATLEGLGMRPLVVRKEIDAHIADRLLEAAWREALWLVRDGVATTDEIDAAIRYGFGVRFAQAGMFESYRLGGGEGGMRHFLEQFGPALEWPWSRLTDVPELDASFIDQIVEQDERARAGESVAVTEQARDANLVAILRALKDRDAAAGAVVRAHERRMAEGGGARNPDRGGNQNSE